jgi:hypothetical protein
MLLILLASYLPAGGMSDPFLIGAGFWQRVADTTKHMLLPSLTVALTLYGGYALIVRSSMLERSARTMSSPRGPRACRPRRWCAATPFATRCCPSSP